MNDTANYSSLGGARLLGAYLGDIKFEFIKMIRTPAFAVPTLFFPAMFYVLFGVIMGRGDGDAALHVFARMGVFGTMAPGLFGFGVSLAFEREYGLLTYKQALPTPPGSYLLARMVIAMLFAAIISALLIVLAVFAAQAPLTAWIAVKIFLVEVLGVLPFCAIGLFVGAMVSGQAAPAVVNIIYLPMAFLSGLWVPFQYLPIAFLKDIAPLWPSFHLSQIALHAVGVDSYGSLGSHIAALTGVTLLFFTIAMRRLANGGLRLFGARRPGTGFSPGKALSMGVTILAIGLVIAGVMGGHAKVPAASSQVAADSGDGSAATGAASGIAAPATTVLAEFDAGSTAASYGLGWTAGDDKTRGGNSAVTLKLIQGGADDSPAALEVAGAVGDAIQYPFGGTVFFPNAAAGTEFSKFGFMDYSTRQRLRFFARGDGQTYTVMFLGPAVDTIPAMYSFAAGPEWREVNVPLKDLAGLDIQRVKMIGIGTMNPGPFRFEIDNVRIE